MRLNGLVNLMRDDEDDDEDDDDDDNGNEDDDVNDDGGLFVAADSIRTIGGLHGSKKRTDRILCVSGLHELSISDECNSRANDSSRAAPLDHPPPWEDTFIIGVADCSVENVVTDTERFSDDEDDGFGGGGGGGGGNGGAAAIPVVVVAAVATAVVTADAAAAAAAAVNANVPLDDEDWSTNCI